MANQKIGAVSLSDIGGGGSSEQRPERGRFLKLQQGSNAMRFVTDAYQYFSHKYKFTEKGYARNIPCSRANGSCVVCELGDKPKKRWYFGVISRASGMYQILDANYSIVSDIKTLDEHADWGDKINYDIDIVKNQHAKSPNDFYKGVAKPPKPMSAADLKEQESIDLAQLERLCQPATPEKVKERYEALLKEETGGSVSSKPAEPTKVSFMATASTNDDDFKNADEIPF